MRIALLLGALFVVSFAVGCEHRVKEARGGENPLPIAPALRAA